VDDLPDYVRALCEDSAALLGEHGISVVVPWEGTVDELQLDRFQGMLAAIQMVIDVVRGRCAYLLREAERRITGDIDTPAPPVSICVASKA
jgi:hypothetical protein